MYNAEVLIAMDGFFKTVKNIIAYIYGKRQ